MAQKDKKASPAWNKVSASHCRAKTTPIKTKAFLMY
jgi:hypothetical protein